MRRKHLLFASETNVFHLKATGLEVPPERVTTRRFGCFRKYVAGQVTRIPLMIIYIHLPIKFFLMGEASINQAVGKGRLWFQSLRGTVWLRAVGI